LADTDLWRSGGKVLFRGLCTAGGMLAPALAVTDPSLPHLILALGAGTLGMLGSWRVNAAMQEAADRDRGRLPETGVLLRNHDLNLLVTEALKRAILLAATDKIFRDRRKLIESLAEAVSGYFQSLEKAPPDALSQSSLPNIVARFSQGPRTESDLQLDQKTFESFLDDLAQCLKSSSGLEDIKVALAKYLECNFDPLVIAVFKEDSTGRGPTQGRGWAALTLLFWGRLLSDVKSLRQYAANQDELMMSLLNAEARVAAKLDELVRWHGPLAADQGQGLALWLKSVHHQLATKLDEISELVGHGLQTPGEFRLGYWNKRRFDPGLQPLWEDPERAAILTNSLVGRASEVAEFDAFLRERSQWVQFWKGWPGTGKSRLMIELAQWATAAGYRVFFVSPDVHDLKAALLRIKSPEPLVLLWDDYQGENPEALRVFLELQSPPANPAGPVVKRAITSWPTHNVLGEKNRLPHLYSERELRAIVPNDDLVNYCIGLLPSLSRAEAARLVKVAESHPEAVLRGIQLVLEGRSVDNLPPNLLEASYDDVIKRLVARRGFEEIASIRRTLVAMALVGRVDLGSVEQQRAFDAAVGSETALGMLADARTITSDGQQVWSLNLDSFRSHVLRRSLDSSRPDVLFGSPTKLAELARPLLPEWFDAIWGICTLATEGTPHGNALRSELLRVLEDAAEELSVERVGLVVARMLLASRIEPDSAWREELANLIRDLGARRDTAAFLQFEALVLLNAAFVKPETARILAIADRIAQLVARRDTPEMAHVLAMTYGVATNMDMEPGQRAELANRIEDLFARHDSLEIAVTLAEALYNATVGELRSNRISELVYRIGELLSRFDDAEIALALARALVNASCVESDAERRRTMAGQIEALLGQHDTAEVALALARALGNVAVVERDPDLLNELCDRMRALRQRHDTADIALTEAHAFQNATLAVANSVQIAVLVGRIEQLANRHATSDVLLALAEALYNLITAVPDLLQREVLTSRIAELRARHDSDAIAYLHAKALHAVSAAESDPRRREYVADRIAEVLMQHDTNDVAFEQAKALSNASVGEENPQRIEALANRIGDLLEEHDTSDIAFAQAMTLHRASVAADDPIWKEELANRIGALLTRHDTDDIAVQHARALYNLSVEEPQTTRKAVLADKIGQIRQQHDTAEIALVYSHALYNIACADEDPRRREAIADRIGDLLASHDTDDIALVQAKALVNTTAVLRDPQRSEALADRIGGLLARHDTLTIAGLQVAALYNAAKCERDLARVMALENRMWEINAAYASRLREESA